MKKLFFAMAAMAAMLTSCSKDETTPAPVPQRSMVTFTVNAPELATRADEGDGTTATNLQWVIYDLAEEVTDANIITGSKEFNLTTSVEVSLVEGRRYEAIFFASAPDSPYTFNKTAQTMTINPNDLSANNEDYDAFYKYVEPFEIETSEYNVEVKMKRPFAQLNVATIDYQNEAYPAGKMIDAATTGVKVKAYKTLDLKFGGVSEPETFVFDLASADVLKASDKIKVNGVEYTWLSMNYILVNARELVTVEFSFTDKKGANNDEVATYTRTYSDVPVERNHRTNIVGTILTSPTNFDVEILPGFKDSIDVGSFRVGDADSNEYYDDFATAVAAAIGGNLPLSLVQNAWYDADVAGPITIGKDQAGNDQTLTINLNGHTLCGDADADLAYLFEIEDGGKLIINGKVITRGGASDTDDTISSSTGIFHVTGGTLEINNATIKSSNIPVKVENTGEATVTIEKSTLIGGSDDDVAFWVDNDANLDELTLNIFGTENNVFEGDIKFGDGDDSYTVDNEGYYYVASWAEFTDALDKNMTMIKLSADIEYASNYQLQKSVTIDLKGKSMTLPMINIHTKTTIKNGTINGKVYARTGSDIVFDNLTFSGAVSDNLSTEGHLAIKSGCKLYAKDCLFSPTSVSGSQTKPLSFEGGSSNLKFENCEFKSSPYKKQVYLNSLSATGTIDFTNCNFNNKTPNIMFAAACPLTKVTMSGTTKLSSVTFEINRAKDALTDADLAHLQTLIANNSFSSVRLFYAGGSSEYIR